jgi:hypothetical protein
MAKDRNPIIQKGLEIGAVDAEFDAAFLMECFIDNSAYSTVSDFENNKMILAGRTGSGKTALFKHMEVQREDECSYISLPEMALSYVTNSDYINFLLQLGTDLELFLKHYGNML